MNEPKNAHFVLSDAQYCHVLEDRLVVGKAQLPEKLPAIKNSFDGVLMFLQVAGFLVLSFFLVMTLITHYYVVTFMLLLLLLLLVVSVIRTLGYTNTPVLMKADILSVQLVQKKIGNDYFIIKYSGEHGKLWHRRLTIYDSAASLKQAVIVMKEAGLLK